MKLSSGRTYPLEESGRSTTKRFVGDVTGTADGKSARVNRMERDPFRGRPEGTPHRPDCLRRKGFESGDPLGEIHFGGRNRWDETTPAVTLPTRFAGPAVSRPGCTGVAHRRAAFFAGPGARGFARNLQVVGFGCRCRRGMRMTSGNRRRCEHRRDQHTKEYIQVFSHHITTTLSDHIVRCQG